MVFCDRWQCSRACYNHYKMSDLAHRIRTAREKMGVSVEEAERATKIRRRYIEAIESGDFERLPDGPPSRGFVKNYSRYLGMDPDQSLTDFEAEVGVPITQISEVVPPPPTHQQAVSRYTQLVKLPQVQWKGDLPPDEATELDMMAAGEGETTAADLEAQQVDAGRLVLRRSESAPTPNSFSLREPKIAQASDVKPFQLGHSPFSLRSLTIPFSSQAAAQPHHITPMSMTGQDHTRALLTLVATVGAVVLVLAFALVIVPALNGLSSKAAAPEATPVITISYIGATPDTSSSSSAGMVAGTLAITSDISATADAPATGVLASTANQTVAGTNTTTADPAQYTPTASDASAQTSITPAAQAGSIPPLAGGGVLLTLDAKEHAWVRVRVDGNVVYEGIPPIGPNSQWHGQNTVGIETADAGAFDVIINNVSLGPAGSYGSTAKLNWNSNGQLVP